MQGLLIYAVRDLKTDVSAKMDSINPGNLVVLVAAPFLSAIGATGSGICRCALLAGCAGRSGIDFYDKSPR